MCHPVCTSGDIASIDGVIAFTFCESAKLVDLAKMLSLVSAAGLLIARRQLMRHMTRSVWTPPPQHVFQPPGRIPAVLMATAFGGGVFGAFLMYRAVRSGAAAAHRDEHAHPPRIRYGVHAERA